MPSTEAESRGLLTVTAERVRVPASAGPFGAVRHRRRRRLRRRLHAAAAAAVDDADADRRVWHLSEAASRSGRGRRPQSWSSLPSGPRTGARTPSPPTAAERAADPLGRLRRPGTSAVVGWDLGLARAVNRYGLSDLLHHRSETRPTRRTVAAPRCPPARHHRRTQREPSTRRRDPADRRGPGGDRPGRRPDQPGRGGQRLLLPRRCRHGRRDRRRDRGASRPGAGRGQSPRQSSLPAAPGCWPAVTAVDLIRAGMDAAVSRPTSGTATRRWRPGRCSVRSSCATPTPVGR